jgi:hypothetical protein
MPRIDYFTYGVRVNGKIIEELIVEYLWYIRHLSNQDINSVNRLRLIFISFSAISGQICSV